MKTYNHALSLATEKWLRKLGVIAQTHVLYEEWAHHFFDWDQAWFQWNWMMSCPGWVVELDYQGLCRAMEVAAGRKLETHLAERQRLIDEWEVTRERWCAESDDPFLAINRGWKKPETVEEHRVALINGMGHVRSKS